MMARRAGRIPVAATNRRPRWLRRLLVASTAVVLSPFVAAAAIYLYVEHGGNFHAVEPGVFYRSAELSGTEFRDVIRAHHVKTVLNLRGPNAGKDWYDDEIRAVRDEGVVHLDIPLSAQHELTPVQVSTVLEMIRTAPKPILVHCNAGSDRTGLVSAMYELTRGKPADVAERQLSLAYGHFPWLGSKTVAMDRSFATFVIANEIKPPAASIDSTATSSSSSKGR